MPKENDEKLKMNEKKRKQMSKIEPDLSSRWKRRVEVEVVKTDGTFALQGSKLI